MLLQPYVANQIWLYSYPIRLAGTRFGARMTVIRLASGQLILHSPCDITAMIAADISALGPVGHIIAPGNFHHRYLATAQAAFPRAKTWICPGVESKRPNLRYDRLLGDASPVDWADEIDQVLVKGARIMREVAMFHRASRTLILVDLIENFTDATPLIGGTLKFWFKYVLRMWNKPCLAPEYRIGWKDKEAAAESLRHILTWDFQQIVLSHGDLIANDARAVAAKAWAGMLQRSSLVAP